MFKFTYPAKIKKDEAGFFLVTFPDIPFAATDGKTMAEALEEARDCLEEAIAVSIADNLDFPFPSLYSADSPNVCQSSPLYCGT